MSKADRTTASSTHGVRFMGRQPILNREGHTYGHEMLFRSGFHYGFSGDPEAATSDVIDHLLLLMPSGENQASFVNCTREALVSGIVTLLPPARTVLEILETVRPDQELMEYCVMLKERGYRFALDDFCPDEVQRPFLTIADYIKVDFRLSDAAVRREIYAMADGTKALFIAEKVETEEDVRVARDEGCELFQGYFFCKPVIIQTRVIPEDQFIYLRLLAALTRSPADLMEIEELVRTDSSLCYRLLRLVNSSLYGLRTQVTSIRNALLMVGDNEFRKMVTVAVARNARTEQPDSCMHLALERARFCELLAPVINESASRLYLLGMLSLLDVILGMPMMQLVDTLPLEPNMKIALLGGGGPLGLALDLVRCHETGDWRGHQEVQARLGIPSWKTSALYIESVVWADLALRV